jgi:hypothetical protein
MKIRFELALAAMVSLFIVGCSNSAETPETTGEDVVQNSNEMPPQISGFLNEKYPGLDVRSWELNEDEYEVVFLFNGNTYESAFDIEGNWFITERPIDAEEVPEAVKNAFAASEFNSWEIIDIQFLSMPDNPELYMYELADDEGEGEELFFDREGNLIQAQRE